MKGERQAHSPAATALAALLFTATFLLLIAVAAAALLPACGIHLPFGRTIEWCRDNGVVVAPSANTTAALKDRIASLEAQLAQRSCTGSNEEAGLATPPAPEPADPVEQACRVDPDSVNTVLIIDGSSSMLVPLDVDTELEARLMRAGPLDFVAQAKLESLKHLPGEKRITAAKAAAKTLLSRIPESRRRAMTFRGCNAISRYTGDSALDGIAGIHPEGGTPIAESLLAAAAMLDPDTPGSITLVTDGGESCDGDICAVARSIKQRSGGTVINIIDLSGWTEIGCVDEITGGKHITYEDGMDLSSIMEEQALAKPFCEN